MTVARTRERPGVGQEPPRSGRGAKRRGGAAAKTWPLLAIVAILNIVGLVMVLSASYVQALRDHGSSWHYFNRQAAWVVCGAIALIATARVDYRRWRKFAPALLVLSIALMVLVLVPGVGIRVGGSSRWLGYGPLRMQPSELAKLALVLFSADLLARRADRIYDWRTTGRPVMLALLAVALLLMLQPDLGTTIVTACSVMAVLFVVGTPIWRMGGLTSLGALGVLGLAKLEPYRWRRMTSFWDPWADVANTGYQAAQGQVALASGGLFGLGLGASRAKWGFLPAAHTDFIFAIIGEELGLAGALLVVSLFAGLAICCVRAALHAPDLFGTLVAAGITAWLIGQAIVNIGAVIGVLPVTGVPLPFVSSGGSSLLIAMASTGILVNLTRQSGRRRQRAGASL